MGMNTARKRLVPISFAAQLLHVPRAWLAAECESGRLPHLRAGDKILVDLLKIENILWERAQKPASEVRP